MLPSGPSPPPQDSLYLLITTLTQQIQTCTANQEALRQYFLEQLDAVRGAYATKDNLRKLEQDIIGVQDRLGKMEDRLDVMEDNILRKIETVAQAQNERQKESYKRIIAIQATVLLAIVSTVISAIATLFHH